MMSRDRFAELDLARMEQGLLLILAKPVDRDHFHQLDRIERPTMARGHGGQFDLGFRQGDVQALFALFGTRQQEAEPERRLAGPGRAFDQVDALARQAAGEDVVQPLDAGGGDGSPIDGRLGHLCPPFGRASIDAECRPFQWAAWR